MATMGLLVLKKLLGRRKDEERGYDAPSRKSNKVRLIAIIPILVTITAFILSFLCVYAGHTPGMMEDYALFTLNASRIGQNIRQELDDKIMAFNFDLNKRSAPLPVALPVITATPTTMVTLAPRLDIGNAFSSLTAKGGDKIDSAESAVHSKANSLENQAHSKANSVESAIESKVTGAVGAVQTDLVHLVNRAFNEIIDSLELQDFYSLHVMTTCQGTYQFSNGTNITLGDSSLPDSGTHRQVDSCSSHSAIDPLSFLNVFYWVGVVLTGIAMVTGFVGIYLATWKACLFNVLATVPAFLMMGISSALAHGVAVGVPKLIDFIGGGIGIDGVTGDKFLQLTWAVVILLFVNGVFWGLLLFLAKRAEHEAGAGGKEMYASDAIPMGSLPRRR